MLFLKVFTQFMPLTFAWNSNVHLSLTATGLTDALGRLEQDGVLKSMGLSRGVVQAMFSWLGLYNTAEDVEYCNFNDKIDAKIIEWAKLPKYAPGITEYMADEIKKMSANSMVQTCAVELGGDQITHFMQSTEAAGESVAWNRSYNKILKNSQQAWQSFSETFPDPKSMWARLQGLVMEAKDLSIFDMVFGGVIKDNVIAPDKENTNPTIAGVLGSWAVDRLRPQISDFRNGEHLLGRALHTLQDSFSPAHVCRDAGGRTIRHIFMYDNRNRDPNPEIDDPQGYVHDDYCGTPCPWEALWPGHHPFDHIDTHPLLEKWAAQASSNLIYAVLYNVHASSGVATGQINNVLQYWLQPKFVA